MVYDKNLIRYSYKPTLIFTSDTSKKWGPVAQHGWSVRLIIERSAVRIRLGPPFPLTFLRVSVLL